MNSNHPTPMDLRPEKLLAREQGFTLTEIMIGMGLLGILALIVSSLLFTSAKQQSRIQTRGEIYEFTQRVMTDIRMKPLPSPSP